MPENKTSLTTQEKFSLMQLLLDVVIFTFQGGQSTLENCQVLQVHYFAIRIKMGYWAERSFFHLTFFFFLLLHSSYQL